MPTIETTEAGPATLVSETEFQTDSGTVTADTVEIGSRDNGVAEIGLAAVNQPPPAAVRLTAPDVDFGSGAFIAGAPIGFGTLTWDLSTGTLEPGLTGTLYMNNSLGREAKMQMRFFDLFDNHLATKYGGSVTPTSSALHQWSVNLSPYANNAIYRVEVSTLVHYTGNTWWIYDRESYTI